MIRMARAAGIVWVCLLFGVAGAPAQQMPPAEPQTAPAVTSPDQQAQFDAAKRAAAAGLWGDALAALKPLHQQLPDDADLTRFTAESALDAGDVAYAIAQLKPLVEAKPGNWQEMLLMARAYAETHDAAARDAMLARLVELHTAGRHEKFNAVQVFLVERVALPKGHLDLYFSLVPWSRYNIFVMARVFDATGQQVQRITLESGDGDQPLWAKQHPDLAAKGMRMFSMDGYTEQYGSNGQHTQTHATYGFFDGRPAYDAVRDRMVVIASGKGGPMSTLQGIPMPAKQ